jgi:hypothetical protein
VLTSNSICVTCGATFTRLSRRGPGLVGQCYSCGVEVERERQVARHVGLQGGKGINKAANIELFRNPTLALANLIRSINRGRFGANTGLGIGSTTSVQKEREGD